MTQSQKDQDEVKPLSKGSVFKFIESRMAVTEPEVKTWGITIYALHDKKKGGGRLATPWLFLLIRKHSEHSLSLYL